MIYPESFPIKHIIWSDERHTIEFLPFSPKWQSSTQDLILRGLKEHFGVLDKDLNPDLDNISEFYNLPHQKFIIGISLDRVVGTGALIAELEESTDMRKSTRVGRICRMSVDQSLRNQNIASSILFLLESEAHRLGYGKIVLETTKEWIGVQTFYKSCGYIEKEERDGNVHFYKVI
ncbi:MAG: GNAT family N-acetyltransferase [Promethearchaeota archaeon]